MKANLTLKPKVNHISTNVGTHSRGSSTSRAPVKCANHKANAPETANQDRRNTLVKITMTVLAGALATETPRADALPGFKKDLSNKRRQTIPEDQFKDGPEGLKYYDIKTGTGAVAQLGSRVAVHFDAKWKGITFVTSRQGMGVTGGTPLGFDVGAEVGKGGTLKGLDLGVRGMRVGGQRKLIVPPKLAYGSKGYGEVPPDSTLIFDVELLSIKTNPIGTRVKLIEG